MPDSTPPADDRGREITGAEARRIADEVLRENEQRRLPPADDQAARLITRIRHELDQGYAVGMVDVRALLAECDRRGEEIAQYKNALDQHWQNRVEFAAYGDRQRDRARVLSGMLRGMARRASGMRQGLLKALDAGHQEMRWRLDVEAARDTYAAREEHALHVRDVALAQTGQVRAERATLWKILGRPDGNGASVELCDAVADERDARRRFQKDAAESEARLAAFRALADEWTQELLRWRGTPQNFAKSTAEHLLGTHAADVRAVLNGPTEAPADDFVTGDWPAPVGTATHDLGADEWIDEATARVSVGPAEAAEPAREWAILNPPTGLMADLREELRIEQEIAAEAGAPEPDADDNKLITVRETWFVDKVRHWFDEPLNRDSARSCSDVAISALRWAARGVDQSSAGSVATTVPPAPGYPRIADAITAACEAADIDLTVVHDGRVLDYVPGVVWLATVLDKAGLIDWAAFQDEAAG